ncbi:MAG: FAD-dependent oxidoreductase, partial [Gordonibacter sp.]
MSDFDAIVVGAGCAGSVAAFELAKAGKSVLVVERGNFAGAKNMTGGRIYSHSLKKVFPDFESEAPLERKITHERMAFMDPCAQMAVDFTSPELAEEGKDSYSVLRAPFDQWLASKAEEAGAEYIYGIAVEDLVKDAAGKISGVIAGEDQITAEIVLLCDGVNSLLSEKAVGASCPPPAAIAVGVKQVIELPSRVITDRVLAGSDQEGAAWLFSGYSTHGTFGGGFMYTNNESISLGVVAGIEATMNHGKASVCQMLEDLKEHPAVAPLIKGGKVVEHSG